MSGKVEVEGQIVVILHCNSIGGVGMALGPEESSRELLLPIAGTYHACHGGDEGRLGREMGLPCELFTLH